MATLRCSLLVLTLLLIGAAAQAQTPVISVAGVGKLAFTIPTATLADAQALVYRAYIGTRPAIAMKGTCTGTAAPFACTVPLADMKGALTSNPQAVALSAASVTPDGGEVESPKATAPFVLRLAGPPATPVASEMSIQP